MQFKATWCLPTFVCLLAFVSFFERPIAVAQEIPPYISSATVTQSVEKRAANGSPFGVFTASIPLPPEFQQRTDTEALPRVLVSDAEGRVFYPVLKVQTQDIVESPPQAGGRLGRPGGLLDRVRSAVRAAGKRKTVPVAIRVSGLYRGDGPLAIRLDGELSQQIEIEPSTVGASHGSLLRTWWQDYIDNAKLDVSSDDFPKLVHQYLVAMLSGRTKMIPIDLTPEEEKEDSHQELETLALLAAIEPLREEIFEAVLNQPAPSAPARSAVPPEPLWTESPVTAPFQATEIEDIATRVPPECFYLRFGSFANYVWFQDIAERYGGDMAQAVLLRGFNYEASAKTERMLAAKMTQLAKMFGDKLIGDMAVIGSDLYMKEGASLGVVFYAKNPQLLASAIQSDRKAMLRKHEDAKLQSLQIAGHEVLLLSTPDNRIRSFYVNDGPYVCVTTSRTIVERFLKVGQGEPSLADMPHFQAARSWMPDSNQYSVFAYFSPQFFQRLVSPQYQIELRRRLEAIAHLEIAELASQVAVAEGVVPDDLGVMQQMGLVPKHFNQRTDGSEAVRFHERWIDSKRGARGSFLPIADVEIQAVSEPELRVYESVANFYLEEWQQMDPMIFGLRRFQADDGTDLEKVAFEGYIAPFQAEKYGWAAKMLSDPSPIEIQTPADDAASVQFHLRGNQAIGPKSGDYILFGGVKDMLPPPLNEKLGLIQTVQVLKASPAYLGAWPKPGLIEQLPLGLGRSLSNPDFAGFSRMLGGLWRWQDATFSLLSFDRSILDNAIPQIAAVEADDLAQARLKVAPLKGSELAGWVNQVWYERSWKSSHGNTRLLDTMHQQLRVPSDECLDATQKLLDVKLQCPLGGEYEFVSVPTGNGGWWRSTAWQHAAVDEQGRLLPPPDYEAPWIDWFRGGKVHLTQGSNSLAVIGEIDLELKPLSIKLIDDEPMMLPKLDFDLFSLPKTIFGASTSDAEDKTERAAF